MIPALRVSFPSLPPRRAGGQPRGAGGVLPAGPERPGGHQGHRCPPSPPAPHALSLPLPPHRQFEPNSDFLYETQPNANSVFLCVLGASPLHPVLACYGADGSPPVASHRVALPRAPAPTQSKTVHRPPPPPPPPTHRCLSRPLMGCQGPRAKGSPPPPPSEQSTEDIKAKHSEALMNTDQDKAKGARRKGVPPPLSTMGMFP